MDPTSPPTSSTTPLFLSNHSNPDFIHAFLTIPFPCSAFMSAIARSTHVATSSLVGGLVVP